MLRVLPFVALLAGSMAAAIKSSADKAADAPFKQYTRGEMFPMNPGSLDGLFEQLLAQLPEMMEDSKIMDEVSDKTGMPVEDIREQVAAGLAEMKKPDVQEQIKAMIPKFEEQVKNVVTSVEQMSDEEKKQMMEKVKQSLEKLKGLEKQSPEEMKQIMSDLASEFSIQIPELEQMMRPQILD